MAKIEVKRESRQEGPPQPVRKPAFPAAGDIGWHPFWRWVVSLLLLLHGVAVFSAPWDLSTLPALPPGYVPPSDNLGRELPPPPPGTDVWQQPVVPRALRRFFHHYLNLVYLNHGYEFFAPDPNGSMLIQYRIQDSGGKEIAAGQLPDLKTMWPRLYYHRHLVLAAQSGDMGPASGRQLARHLLKKHAGQSIRMDLVLHKLLSPKQVLAGTELGAASTLQTLATIQETAQAVQQGSTALPIQVPGGGL